MECLGGNGYVEEGVLARLYREAPVNAIWEGSGNVMCLDVLRALSREGEAARAVLARPGRARAAICPARAEAAAFIGKTLSAADGEARARAAVERLALLAAAAALAEGAPGEIAQAFARTRLADTARRTYSAPPTCASGETAELARARACPPDRNFRNNAVRCGVLLMTLCRTGMTSARDRRMAKGATSMKTSDNLDRARPCRRACDWCRRRLPPGRPLIEQRR